MRTQEEAEAWAVEHSAVLKVNFSEKAATLQVGGFAAHSNTGGPLASVLPELVAVLEQQLGDRLTQPGPLSAELARGMR